MPLTSTKMGVVSACKSRLKTSISTRMLEPTEEAEDSIAKEVEEEAKFLEDTRILPIQGVCKTNPALQKEVVAVGEVLISIKLVVAVSSMEFLQGDLETSRKPGKEPEDVVRDSYHVQTILSRSKKTTTMRKLSKHQLVKRMKTSLIIDNLDRVSKKSLKKKSSLTRDACRYLLSTRITTDQRSTKVLSLFYIENGDSKGIITTSMMRLNLNQKFK